MAVRFDNKKVESYFANSDRRVKALQDFVLGKVAQGFAEAVQENADRQNESYADHVQVNRVRDGQVMFLVRVDQRSRAITTSPELAVYYYVPISPISSTQAIIGALKANEPYVRGYLPYRADRSFRLVFRKVSEDERVEIESRNQAGFANLKRHLLAVSDDPSRVLEPGDIPEETQVVEDYVWRVVRQELGLREQKVPVWVPAIHDFRTGKVLKEALNDSAIERILIDGKFDGLGDSFDSDETTMIRNLERFQEYILKF